MSGGIQRFQIRQTHFKGCEDLQSPLNEALVRLQDQVATATAKATLMELVTAEVLVSSNTPGTAPWPLRIAQVVGAPRGVLLLSVQNLTSPGVTGVGTAAVSITSQSSDGISMFVDFISGLTLNSRYRLVFGVLNAQP